MKSLKTIIKLLAISLFFIGLSGIPYVAGYFYQPEGKVFLGTVQSHDNTTSYYSFITQYQQGELLADNRLTPEAHKGVYFNLEWFLVGNISRFTGTGFDSTLQAWRVVSIILYVCALYLFTGLVSSKENLRLAAIVLFGVSGGFVWVVALLGKLGIYKWPQVALPLDTTSGIFPIAQMIIWPHFSFSIAFLVFGLYFFVRGLRTNRAAMFFMAGMSNVVLWLSRPYDGLNMTMAVAVYGVFYYWSRMGPIKKHVLLMPVLISIPAVAYNYLSLYGSAAFGKWGSQAVVPPAPPLTLLISLGLLLPLFIYSVWSGSARGRLRDEPVMAVTLVTAIVVVALYYTYPVIVYSNQFIISLTTLMMLFCFAALAPKLDAGPLLKGKNAWMLVLVLTINSLSTVYSIGWRTCDAREGKYSASSSIVSAYRWLEENTNDEDTVLGALLNSQYMFRFSRNRVFIGHHSQTINIDEKRQLLKMFFNQGTPDDSRARLLSEYNIKYVLYGPEERKLGDYNPGNSPFLTPVFSNQEITVFKVAGWSMSG